MSLPVALSAEAEAELEAAVDWYEQRAGSGSQFVVRIREALARIGQAPELHAVIYANIRRAVVRRSPYSIYYGIRPDHVEVISVFHGIRDPTNWQGRVTE
jgi:plasmid stabilization system protein ParE